MLLEVKVIPKASRDRVKEEGPRLKVYVTAAPEKGRANDALLEMLADHFNVGKNRIRIVKGHHAQIKTVEIVI